MAQNKCTTCDGTGVLSPRKDCSKCNGRGTNGLSEDWGKEDCYNCNGTGKIGEKCYMCKGSGERW